ncbi:MAG: hypothetical protein K8S27_14115 [Candidatus Omnitrophica bacterium]|nr:hypothetical protein [Candidatus Omnitrophota bacterium]
MVNFKLFILMCCVSSLLICSPKLAWAEGSSQISPEIVDLCNKVMMNVYEYLIESQQEYRVLREFNPQTLTKNEYGIYTINYVYADPYTQWRNVNFEIGVSIVDINDPLMFKGEPITMLLEFPLIGIKLLAFQKDSISTSQFDIMVPLRKYGKILWDAQQDYISIKLSLVPKKEKFVVGEPISFTARLENSGKVNVVLKKLSSKTLLFTFDNIDWNPVSAEAAAEGALVKEVMLSPGAFFQKNFKIQGIREEPGELEIFATYVRTIKGIHPSARMSVPIVAKEEQPE